MFSLSTPVAYISAVVLIGWAIANSGAGVEIFISPASMAIVLGGTIAATIISYDMKAFLKALAAIFRSFMGNNHSKKHLVEITEFFIGAAAKAKKGDFVSIEEEVPAALKKDPVFLKGINLLVSRYSSDQIRTVLNNTNDAVWQQYTADTSVLNRMASYAPGFGVMGTIIGLMGMMQNMSGDMAQMGQSLAVAFVTTFYGILLAQLLFKPSAGALTTLQEGAHYRGQILVQAFVAIADKMDPEQLKDRLEPLVDPMATPQLEGEG